MLHVTMSTKLMTVSYLSEVKILTKKKIKLAEL